MSDTSIDSQLNSKARTRVFGALVALNLTLIAPSCATSPSVDPPAGASEMPTRKLVFRAAVTVLEDRNIPIETRSTRFGIISSPYIETSSTRRHKYIVRLLKIPGRAVPVRVRIKVQKRPEGVTNKRAWENQSRSGLSSELKRRETALVRAIERRYKQWESSVD